MSRRLTEAERLGVIRAYAETGNYRQVARDFGISDTAVRKLIAKSSRGSSRELHAQAKASKAAAVAKYEDLRARRTLDILEHLESRKTVVCGILDLALEKLADPEKYEKASLQQIASVVATLIDKFAPIRSAEERASVIESVARGLFDGGDEGREGASDEGAGRLPEAAGEAD